jgi:hypothetical protein
MLLNLWKIRHGIRRMNYNSIFASYNCFLESRSAGSKLNVQIKEYFYVEKSKISHQFPQSAWMHDIVSMHARGGIIYTGYRYPMHA